MSETRGDRRDLWLGTLVIAALLAGVFGEFVLGDGKRLPSHKLGDTVLYFASARSFATEQILAGELPLWNPHTFSGTPFVGVFQSSIFYPLAALHLVLPAARAFSLEFVLNLFVLGFFVLSWLRGWGLHWLSCCFAAVIAMFGGTVLTRVLAGQLSLLGTFAYVPLVLLAIDRLAERPRVQWTLAGIAGASLMLFAGHPPTFLMAGVTIALYCIPVILGSSGRARLMGALLCIPIGVFFVSAVQLWTGLQVASDGARTGGLSYEAATKFSLPPENLLTLVSPDFFGSGAEIVSYFGRWWYWDVTVFVGCAALALAIHGALAARGPLRNRALGLAIVLTVVALGRYTPVYELLYHALPGLSSIRAPSKYMFFVCLFIAALAALGTDHLLKVGLRDRRGAAVTAGVALFVLALAAWQWLGVRDVLSIEPLTHVFAGLEGHRPISGKRLESWDGRGVGPLLWPSALLAVAAALLWVAPGRRWPVLVLVGLGTTELLMFAQANHGSIPLQDPLTARPRLQKAYARAGEIRVLESRVATNAAVASRGYNMWGYDPMFLHRYAEFIAFTQGRPVSALLDNNRGAQPDRFHPLLAMLRVGFEANKPIRGARPLPRALVVHRYRVEETPEAVLAAMVEPGFDPRRSVVLEHSPIPAPGPARPGHTQIEVTDESSDRVRVEVKLASPAILVLTDAYASGWQARALPGSSQQAYTVQRANAVLRAIPLEAGDHRFEVVYSPLAFRAGAWASAISSSALLLLAGLRLWQIRGRR